VPDPRGSKVPPPLAPGGDVPAELQGAVVTTGAGSEEEATELTDADLEELASFEVPDEPAPPSTATPSVPEQVRPASTHKDPAAPVVLVVEDDASIRTMIVRALGLSYTVYEAEDGEVAVGILDQIAPPACIVTDWMMPRVDGLELAKKVRANKDLKWTPLILLTAKSHPLDVVQGINAGARHYLAKPFKMKELLDKVAHVLSTKK
jgi:CheY-like chemotaxis protein